MMILVQAAGELGALVAGKRAGPSLDPRPSDLCIPTEGLVHNNHVR